MLNYMPNYKPVKLIFDLDDEVQASLYKRLSQRSNKSSYIRQLIYHDMKSETSDVNIKSNTIEVPPFEIIKDTHIQNQTYEHKSNGGISIKIGKPAAIIDDDLILDGIV